VSLSFPASFATLTFLLLFLIAQTLWDYELKFPSASFPETIHTRYPASTVISAGRIEVDMRDPIRRFLSWFDERDGILWISNEVLNPND